MKLSVHILLLLWVPLVVQVDLDSSKVNTIADRENLVVTLNATTSSCIRRPFQLSARTAIVDHSQNTLELRGSNVQRSCCIERKFGRVLTTEVLAPIKLVSGSCQLQGVSQLSKRKK
jgi:hypothetical protein